ncbi:hypothetical protein GCM10008090_25400 [Arenicella chitinivorans]|uniref:Tetratricopeptide repeat protein n=1 Tax=Arenicella chitinivorans TaxID=1329800 RepID=A0A918RVV6_9GAMM|nr:tetratricopeptide repeat protein [Arenicella chitinivorans]GHA14524.1 hypothetical protein GCM10008090_25400 [Arenicella chitinivorans]
MKTIRLEVLGSVLILLLLSACASQPVTAVKYDWMQEVINYETRLGPDHLDSVENLYQVTPEMRATVVARFGKLPKLRALRKMAQWLIDEDGKNMQYNMEANYAPIEAFYRNEGNCLSFTLMLIQLADEIGITLNANEVDIPDLWGENEDRGLVYYRHVNAMYRSDRYTQVFDLAIQEYRAGFPQRFINKRSAAALLFSNLGVQFMQQEDYDTALHYLKLAVSVDAKNPDLWINLSAALRRTGQVNKAEQGYLYAHQLNPRESLAASNLERLYRGQGKLQAADRFQKLASRVRNKNPYLHFYTAQKAFDQRDFGTAAKAVKRAIKLHDKDPQFYELRSRIYQVERKYIAALRDLEKAHNISLTPSERGRYANKVDLVLAAVKQQAEDRQKRFERLTLPQFRR